jgi:hypothetical protein
MAFPWKLAKESNTVILSRKVHALLGREGKGSIKVTAEDYQAPVLIMASIG